MQVIGAPAISAEAVIIPISCKANISILKMLPIGNVSIQVIVAAVKNVLKARITGTSTAKTIGLTDIEIDRTNKFLSFRVRQKSPSQQGVGIGSTP